MTRMIRIIKYMRAFSKECMTYRIDIYAACASFYIFLSFIPFMVVLLSLIPMLPFTQMDLENVLTGIIPVEYKRIVLYITDDLYSHSAGTLSISIIATLWAASRGILGITRGLNDIYGVTESRNLFVMRIFSMLYTVFVIVGVIMMLILSVFGNGIISLINRYVIIEDWVNGLLSYKDIATLALLALLFIFLFVFLPDRRTVQIKRQWKEHRWIKAQIPGAILAALIWWLFGRFFSLFITARDSYSIYGSFAIVIIVGIWLYTGMYIMFVGAVVNRRIASKKGNI